MDINIPTLTDAYFGLLGKYTNRRVKDLELGEKARQIAGRYPELVTDFSDNMIERGEKIPGELLQKLKQAGFFGMTIPEKYGRLGITLKEYLALVEAMASESLAVGITIIAHLSIGIKFIFRSLFPGFFRPLKVGTPALKPSARMVSRLVRKIFIVTLLGLIRYGERIRWKEFLLRRITFLSMYAFGILAMIAQIETARHEGEPIDTDNEILRFFVHEARQYTRHHAGWFSGAADRITEKVFSTIEQPE